MQDCALTCPFTRYSTVACAFEADGDSLFSWLQGVREACEQSLKPGIAACLHLAPPAVVCSGCASFACARPCAEHTGPCVQQAKNGNPPSHAFVKEMLAGIAGKLCCWCCTKGCWVLCVKAASVACHPAAVLIICPGTGNCIWLAGSKRQVKRSKPNHYSAATNPHMPGTASAAMNSRYARMGLAQSEIAPHTTPDSVVLQEYCSLSCTSSATAH